MDSLNFVTGSSNKLREIQNILTDFNVKQCNIDLPEYQGELEFITKMKCLEAKKHVREDQYPIIIEDTSLIFEAMGSLPGPYIKHFLSSMSLENIVKLLDNFENKNATAICQIAYLENAICDPVIFVGRLSGKIVQPRGVLNFGWDPIFQIQIKNTNTNNDDEINDTNIEYKTLAELDQEYKNKISHRYLALMSFKEDYDKLVAMSHKRETEYLTEINTDDEFRAQNIIKKFETKNIKIKGDTNSLQNEQNIINNTNDNKNRSKCQAITPTGNPCKHYAIDNSKYCHIKSHQKFR